MNDDILYRSSIKKINSSQVAKKHSVFASYIIVTVDRKLNLSIIYHFCFQVVIIQMKRVQL